MYRLDTCTKTDGIRVHLSIHTIVGKDNIMKFLSDRLEAYFEREHTKIYALVPKKELIKDFVWGTATGGYYFKVAEEMVQRYR